MSKIISFSLIIPVHNSERTLPCLFRSILRQKINFHEVILINNNSADNSLTLLKEFRIKYHKKFNSTVNIINLKYNNISKSRNIGIEAATSEFVLFVDSDDYLADNYLFFIHKSISNNSCKYYDFYEFNFVNKYFNGKIVANNYFLSSKEYYGKEYLRKVTKFFKEQSKFMCWKYVYRKKFLLENKIYFDENINLLEDVDFIFRCMQHNAKILVLKKNEILYYIQNYNSLTNKQEKDKYYDSILSISDKVYFKEYIDYFLSLSVKVLNLKNYLKLSNKLFKGNRIFYTGVYFKKRLFFLLNI